ncbi:divergent PAP2 family protein [Acholeplasma vituli]|uniref:Divergent PAP2 family protein n=1 Tax=Paracholeplasma vituli TaxID=69473 RepID=A0ABT2PXW2_9MOLU|nr:divergent PAP2 family protein [Paracholeplasma vituli]MCU0105316.1 divergent PAP2 family protein [Paracholeplasma vituli]
MNTAQQIINHTIIALLVAQFLKFFSVSLKEKKPNLRALITTGGMPSSHSATVASLTASIYFYEGIGLYFAISLTLALIVIHDSMGIRLEASKHAMMLNNINEKLGLETDHINKGKALKEPLGHFPIEVFAGVLLGLIISALGYYFGG